MYLVTGSSGNIGSQVAEQLLAQGKKVRLLVRDPGKALQWAGRVQVSKGDLEDAKAFGAAAAGVEGVFLMSPLSVGLEAFRQVLTAVKARGSPRMVFLSSLLAGKSGFSIGQIHEDKENAIRAAGLDGRFVRAGNFMSNTFQWIGSIKEQGMVFNPQGDGRSAPVAPQDIAAVAVHVLTSRSLGEEVFELTGGELLSVSEQVAILAATIGKAIQCSNIPVEAAVQHMIAAGIPVSVAAGMGQAFEAIRDRRIATISDTVERLLSRKPLTFESWARVHAERFG